MSQQNKAFKLANTYKNSMIAAYQANIRQQTQFLKLIKAALPDFLAEHLLYCVVSSKKCLVYTNTEEWAMPLRHHLPIILHTIQASIPTIDFVQVRLTTEPAAQPVYKAKSPSKENIELIKDNLQSMKDDELKQALLRLSRTLDSVKS
jgi:hypothetical protein